MNDSAHRPLRLMYAAGPGDIIGTYRCWREGRDDPGQVSMTYSGQFYDVCRELGAHGYAIASHPRKEVVKEGPFRLEHRQIWFTQGPSLLYHLGQIYSGLRMTITALRYRADALVICDGTCHWFTLRLLAKLGVRIIPTIHCTLWRKRAPPPGRVKRILNWLDLPFWRRSASRILSASCDISKQIEQFTQGEHSEVIEFLPTYRDGTFEAEPPPQQRNPFRVLFAGRIEANKGVFHLLAIAKSLKDAGRNDVEFDVCGNGSAIDDLKRAVREPNLTDRFRIHGHCDRHTMKRMFRQSHVVIVPTTTEFAEGFNQVVVEGVLSCRPVITSDVCPALDYVREAVVEVPPDDVEEYRNAILKLLDDPAPYDQKLHACSELQTQFYDLSKSWAAALKKALAPLRSESAAAPSRHSVAAGE